MKQFLPLEDEHEQFGHDVTDDAAAGECEHPGEHHVLDHAEVDGGQALDRADAHDGAGLGVRGGHGNAEHRHQQQAQRARQVGGEALELLELDHVLPD